MSFTLDSIPAPAPGVVGRVIPGEGSAPMEAVLVLPARGQVKVLNELGAKIWSLLDGRRSVREIAAALCAEYAVGREQAEQDTLEFLNHLAGRGAVAAAGTGES
ncbi:MAG: PqqD family protein [Chloroflexi bacterium]|nr:PqqD family protein [Chloroflexota bacterium]